MILAIETSTPVCSVALQGVSACERGRNGSKAGAFTPSGYSRFTGELLRTGWGLGYADLDAILVQLVVPGRTPACASGQSAIKGFLVRPGCAALSPARLSSHSHAGLLKLSAAQPLQIFFR